MSAPLPSLLRLPLAELPTPLHRLDRLARRLQVDEIYIKRDDLLGRLLGGNKLRKLEYIIPLAQKAGADTLITTGSFESNHACLTTLVARMLGMHAAVVLMGPNTHKTATFNEKIQQHLGVDIHSVEYIEGDSHSRETLSDRVTRCVDELTENLKSKGKTPFLVPPAGCCLEGTFAFALAFDELHQQMTRLGLDSYHIIVPVGTGSTYAGLWCGARHAGADVNIFGVSIARPNPRCTNETIIAADRLCRLFDLKPSQPTDMNITDEFIGTGYAQPTDAAQRAMALLLETEGLLLDHIYTGKAMAGLISMLRQKQIDRRPLVFWHTGGLPGAIDYLRLI